MEFILEPEFWVAVSFFIFVGVCSISACTRRSPALDARAALIAKELEEARRLRDEAAKVLADYRRKEGEAAKEAEHHRPCRQGGRNLRRRDAEIGEGAFRPAHEARRGQDRPGRGRGHARGEKRRGGCRGRRGANPDLRRSSPPDRAEKLVSESIDTLKSKLN